MGINKSKVAMAITGVLCLVGLINFAMQPRTLRVSNAERAIESMLRKHGFSGEASCPEAEWVVDQLIECTARLDSGETIGVGITPKDNRGNGRIYTPDLLIQQNAEAGVVAQLAKNNKTGEVSCPESRVFGRGDVVRCSVTIEGRQITAILERIDGDDARIEFVEAETELAKGE